MRVWNIGFYIEAVLCDCTVGHVHKQNMHNLDLEL
jgi:hypothetical protein